MAEYSEDRDYQGAIPIDGKGGVEEIADDHDVNIVCFEGVAMVYGSNEDAQGFSEEYGSEMYDSVEDAKGATVDQEGPTREAIDAFGGLFS